MGDSRRPRVLMLTSTLPRWAADSEPRFVLDLARHLSRDFDIEILAPHAPGAARTEILEGIRVTRFRYWIPRWQSAAYEGGMSWRLRENPVRTLQLPFFAMSLAWHIFRRLRRRQAADVIHAHWIVPQAAIAIVARSVARRRIPIVTTSHGGDLFGLQSRLWTMVKRWVLQRSDAVTVVSSAMADRVRELVPSLDPAVIPMGTDLQTLFTPPSKPRKGPPRRLIFVGRLVEKKGLTYLIDALPDVLLEYPDLQLDIVGHGPLRRALEEQAAGLGLSNSVTFHGPIAHPELPQYYRRADVAVFPFVEATSGDQEGFGLVMVEAMGCGCAVIASGLPAVRDVLLDGETGWIVPPRDSTALSRAIRRAIADPAVTRAVADRARQRSFSTFDWCISAQRIREVFRAGTSGIREYR